jgi:hypothetical protein
MGTSDRQGTPQRNTGGSDSFEERDWAALRWPAECTLSAPLTSISVRLWQEVPKLSSSVDELLNALPLAAFRGVEDQSRWRVNIAYRRTRALERSTRNLSEPGSGKVTIGMEGDRRFRGLYHLRRGDSDGAVQRSRRATSRLRSATAGGPVGRRTNLTGAAGAGRGLPGSAIAERPSDGEGDGAKPGRG